MVKSWCRGNDVPNSTLPVGIIVIWRKNPKNHRLSSIQETANTTLELSRQQRVASASYYLRYIKTKSPPLLNLIREDSLHISSLATLEKMQKYMYLSALEVFSYDIKIYFLDFPIY